MEIVEGAEELKILVKLIFSIIDDYYDEGKAKVISELIYEFACGFK